ncbi:MAG: nucleotidyltransferase family protein [Pseudomonadota bacterium]
MVLAAGRGTRMRPLTDRMAKAMVPVAGRPLIDHALDRVAAAGIARAVVNLHAHADGLEAHLKTRRAAPELVFSDERAALLDTGGGVLAALPLLGPAPFVTLNGDAIWAGPEPVASLLATWAKAPPSAEALLMLVPRERAHGYSRPGDFFLDASTAPVGVPTRRGSAETAPFVYTGLQVMRPTAFAGIAEAEATGAQRPAFSLNPVWDALAARGALAATVWGGDWVDVGMLAGIAVAEAVLAAHHG